VGIEPKAPPGAGLSVATSAVVSASRLGALLRRVPTVHQEPDALTLVLERRAREALPAALLARAGEVGLAPRERHWLVLARVNDADWNVWPLTPVMSAPAAAFVAVGQFFSRCNVFVFLMTVALTQPVLPGSNTPGTTAADAETVKTSAVAKTPVMRSIFICWSPFDFVLQPWDLFSANTQLHTREHQVLRGVYVSSLARGILVPTTH
jgi:hypothetical protein